AVGCGPSSYGDFRNQLVAQSCLRDRRCGALGASELNCPVPAALAYTTAGTIDVATAVRDGRLKYDSDHAQEGLDAVANAPCDPAIAGLHYLAHCHNVVAPAVETGHACRADVECVGGLCVAAAGCVGTCVAYPAPGARCTPDGGIDPTG